MPSGRKPNENNLKKDPKISLKKVRDLLNDPPEDILLKIQGPHFGLDIYLNAESLGDDLIESFAELLEKALRCNSLRELSSKLMLKLVDSNCNFITKHLYSHLLKKDIYTKDYNINFITNCLNICLSIFEMNPRNITNIEPFKDRLENIIKLKINNQELIDKFNDLEALMSQKQGSLPTVIKKHHAFTTNNMNKHDLDPPNEITELNIIPDLDDLINDTNPFVRGNLILGPYRSVQHYLDVHFRLLREDFMQPLRLGIQELRNLVAEEKKIRREAAILDSKEFLNKLRKIDSINVYFDVKMDSNLLTNSGFVYSFKMNNDKTKQINWERSKRLMFGSLVCLSTDLFKDNFLIGVICERDVKKLKEGIVYIRFDNINHNKSEVNFQAEDDYNYFDFSKIANNLPVFDKKYIMVETTAYFESYRHVLDALCSFYNQIKRDGEDSFPFKENIVFANNNFMPVPKYFERAFIDFRPLVDKSKRVLIDPKNALTKYEFSDLTNYAKTCSIHDQEYWPTFQQFDLDTSQYEALKLALTSKLALIQGPPGTGKTFIGVKIVQLLLHNRELWWHSVNLRRPKPILMICYTNHALDQFLEYIVDECKLNGGIVRVGGRCKSNKLEPFLLRNIKQKKKQEKIIDPHIFHRIKDELIQLKKLRAQVDKTMQIVEHFRSGVLKLKILEHIIDPIFFQAFEQMAVENNHDIDYVFLSWLGFFNINNNRFNFARKTPLEQTSEKELSDDSNEEEEENTKREEKDEGEEIYDEEFHERMLEEDFFENEVIKSKRSLKLKNPKESEKILEDFLNTPKVILDYVLKTDHHKKDEWRVAGRDKKKKKKQLREIKRYLEDIIDFGNDIETLESNTELKFLEINSQNNPWNLSMKEKYLLYNNWLLKYKTDHIRELESLKVTYNQSANNLTELQMQEDRIVMQEALIIACTTTGAARYRTVLKDIGARIVIVEEAAEVFEAHIISSLSKDCEHLILIGDHVQLRPSPNVYKLAKDYKLDVSLFERLIKNNVKKVMLTTQHRMHPSISQFMRHFYENAIIDNSNVKVYPKINGLKRRVYFINHNQKEDEMSIDRSKTNKYEAEYIVKLCNYLVKQDYDQSKITILTMYLGQLMEIKNLCRQFKLTDVKTSTVDNYQGEENDIVLISLVRSNSNNRIGFLAIENRICVALSRAKHSLFCIGNFKMLNEFSLSTEGCKKWSEIIKTLTDEDLIGPYLELTCGRHPENDIIARKPEDFDKRPEGGCRKPCDFRLTCGHVCKLFCHTFDQEHKNIRCNSQCNKKIEKCGHYCKSKCGHNENCSLKCEELTDKITEDCRHKVKVKCNVTPTRKDCYNRCNKLLNCGHFCSKTCNQIPCEPCLIEHDAIATCHHVPSTIKVKCSDKIWNYQERCLKPCDQVLSCSHICTSKCNECYGGYLHNACKEKCDRILICGHKCSTQCANSCLPCQKKCENSCSHSRCPLKCCNPCVPCKEKCSWMCEHIKCDKLCHEICEREPCNEPCMKKLKCNHDCIGLCGEPCPRLCRICDKDKVTEVFFGTEDEPDARFVYLFECKHIVEQTGMDHWIESRFSELNEENSGENTIQLPNCPKCKTPLRRNLRYSKYIKKQLTAIEQVKSKQFGDENQIKQEKGLFLKNIKETISKANESFFENQIKPNLALSLPYNDLIFLKNKWTLFNKITELWEKNDQNFSNMKEPHNLIKYELNKLENKLCSKDANKNQIVNDISLELERVSSIIDYFEIEKFSTENKFDNIKSQNIKDYLNKLYQALIAKINRFDTVKLEVGTYFSKLKELTKLELSPKEKSMIIQAIGLSQGHWYKCRNGHVYCIGECGGAMEKSICPECKEEIGGTQHTLIQTNSLASDFDGAKYAAWSDMANNMENWDIED